MIGRSRMVGHASDSRQDSTHKAVMPSAKISVTSGPRRNGAVALGRYRLRTRRRSTIAWRSACRRSRQSFVCACARYRIPNDRRQDQCHAPVTDVIQVKPELRVGARNEAHVRPVPHDGLDAGCQTKQTSPPLLQAGREQRAEEYEQEFRRQGPSHLVLPR